MLGNSWEGEAPAELDPRNGGDHRGPRQEPRPPDLKTASCSTLARFCGKLGDHTEGLANSERTRSTLACRTRSGRCAVSWQVLPGWRELLLGPQRLAPWPNGSAADEPQVVKHGLRRTVYRVDLPERSVFLKHYRCPDLADAGRHLLRGSASRREYRKAIELARRQVPTIRPVAVGEQHRSGLVADNFLITEAIPNAQSLHVYASETLPGLPPDQQHRLRRKLRERWPDHAAAHEAGVFHDDFHGGNVLRAAGHVPWTGRRSAAAGVVSGRFARDSLLGSAELAAAAGKASRCSAPTGATKSRAAVPLAVLVYLSRRAAAAQLVRDSPSRQSARQIHARGSRATMPAG